MPPNPNPRPGENPADIVTGVRKRKASERSVLASDLPPTGPKRPKATTATGAKRPVAIKVTVAKSSSSLENAFLGRARGLQMEATAMMLRLSVVRQGPRRLLLMT
ncbi:hypothetical protein EDB85DRAFT_1897082 [Lactarius pseudohatsudake]|nr:hypothetical protein EDB85DRAFT_1897082 [Lactarius pseudohatsudake]